MDFLRLIRFPNLLIIVVIQYILQYRILKPTLMNSGVDLLLSNNLFFLLVVSTVLIAATGYVINDIMDLEIDKINKPTKMIVSRIISVKHAWQIYWVLFAIGLIISFYVAYCIDDLKLLVIYPIAVALLALYSYKFKCVPLIGNLIVALFSAMVTGVVLFAERASFLNLHEADSYEFNFISFVFHGYIIFSILMTIYREIVKDLEDMEGDRALKCHTIPTTVGAKLGKFLAALLAITTLYLVAPWVYERVLFEQFLIAGGVTILVLIPLLYSIIKLWSAAKPKEYHHISTCIKVIMAGGIICLLLL